VPSTWSENCPTVIREAFAMGTPVVTADIGGMAEAVEDGVNGLLFKFGDSASLREKLGWLIANPGSLATLARNIVPPLTQEQCTDEIVQIYESVGVTGPVF
jgi:glycosyltransferase involved in cell wall biosynthesis